MKVLFDQNVPRNLLQYLADHDVSTSAKMGWEELENGALLKAAEASGFDVLVTGDQNLTYQQNLSNRKIAIVELTKNNWPSVAPHIARIVTAVGTSKPGGHQTIQCAYVHKAKRT